MDKHINQEAREMKCRLYKAQGRSKTKKKLRNISA